jgi:hypothetical protein
VDVLEEPLADGCRSPAKGQAGVMEETDVWLGVGWGERAEMVVECSGVAEVRGQRLEEVFGLVWLERCGSDRKV